MGMLPIGQILNNEAAYGSPSFEIDELSDFENINMYFNFEVKQKWKLKKADKTTLLRVKYSTREIQVSDAGIQKYSFYESEYFWIYQEVDEDVGHFIVKPYTLEDRLETFFGFGENRKFFIKELKGKYFVECLGENKKKPELDEKFINSILRTDGIIVEYCNNKKLLRYKRGVNANDLETLINISRLK